MIRVRSILRGPRLRRRGMDQVVKMIANSMRVAGALFCVALLLLPGVAGAEDKDQDDPVWLGVLIDDESLDGGIQLIAVIPGGPAARGGLQRGDLLLEADGRGLARTADLEEVLSLRAPGDRLRLKVLREGDTSERQVELAPRPTASWIYRQPDRPLASPPTPPAPPSIQWRPAPSAAYGFTVADVTPDLRTYYGAPREIGVLVTDVRPGRAADLAGLRVGDVLVRLGDVEVRRAAEVDDLLPDGTAGIAAVEARVVRDSRSTVATLAVPKVRAQLAPYDVSAGGNQDFETLEHLIHEEMDILKRRLAELEQRLEELQEVRESSPDR